MGRYRFLVFALVSLGCQKGEECTKARMIASEGWKTVMGQAANAKVKGWVGFDDLSEAQKVESVKTWTGIETQSDMVFKSFAYERITWKTADPAREAANRLFDGYFAKDNFTLFAAALKAANAKYDAAAKLCRD
jgi:hypothetical protein